MYCILSNLSKHRSREIGLEKFTVISLASFLEKQSQQLSFMTFGVGLPALSLENGDNYCQLFLKLFETDFKCN